MKRRERVEASFDFPRLSSEVVDLLRDYLRIVTTNPPGDVSLAADWVADVLAAEGLEGSGMDANKRRPNSSESLQGGEGGQLWSRINMDAFRAVLVTGGMDRSA